MAAAFFFILAVLLLMIRRGISAQIRRMPAEDYERDYAVGARRAVPILKYAVLVCLGLGLLALFAQLLL